MKYLKSIKDCNMDYIVAISLSEKRYSKRYYFVFFWDDNEFGDFHEGINLDDYKEIDYNALPEDCRKFIESPFFDIDVEKARGKLL
jgi:hypothetical protein